jgi:hypothetical protein
MAAVGGPVPPAVHEPATATRWLGKPGPAYPGFPAQGASAPTRGRAWPRALPHGKEASPEGGIYRKLRGVKLRRNGEGQKDPRGRGLPAGIPEAQPAAPGLMGGWWPPNGHSHGGHGLSVAARSGRLDQPRPSPGPHGARRPGKPPGWPRRNRGGFEEPHGLLREESGAAAEGRRGALRPLGPLGLRSLGPSGASSPGREARSTKPGSAHRRPNPPAPPGRGPSFCPRLRKSALLCRGDAPTTKGRVPAKSAGAPTPAGPRVRVPRPTGDRAG